MLDDHTANWEYSKLPIDSDYHLSVTNAFFLKWIENLGNQSKELATDIKTEIQSRDDFNWKFAFGPTGMDLYQLCTLTISYFEICSYIIVSDELRCSPPSDDTKRLVRAIYSRKGHVLDDSDVYGQRQRNAYKRLQSDRNLNAGFYKFVLSESDIIDSNETEILNRVNSIRGDFVHNIFQILEIENKEEVLDLVEDCEVLLELVGDLLHEHVEYDSEVYDIIVKDDINLS
ncbi:hypothetical protein [Halosimplex sp. J119]